MLSVAFVIQQQQVMHIQVCALMRRLKQSFIIFIYLYDIFLFMYILYTI